MLSTRALRRLSLAVCCWVIGLGAGQEAAALSTGDPGVIVVSSELTWMNSGGADVTVPVPTVVVDTPNGPQVLINGGNPFVTQFGPTDTADTVVIDGYALLDPVQTFAVAFTDLGTPNSVTFSLSAPLVPAFSGGVTFTGDLSGSFTDGASDGGSASPFGGSTIARFDIDGVDVLGLGGVLNFASPSDSFTEPQQNGAADCAQAPFSGSCDTFGTTIGFTGSGGGDSYGFTARFEIVPEPATALLLGLGLVGLAASSRRRPR